MHEARQRLGIWALCAAAFALALFVVSQEAMLVNLTRDPASLGGLKPWHGSLSLAALALWSCVGTTCFFGAAALWRLGERDTDAVQFLLATGALATAAAIDDGLQIHENIVPVELGLPEATTFTVWLVAVAAWFARFRAFMLRSDVLMLGLTAIAFAASLVVDLFDPGGTATLGKGGTLTPYEDYCKLTGLATFAWYCWHEALTRVTTRADRPSV